MSKLESSFLDIGYLETLSSRDTPVHRLDPRAKLLATLVFIVCVVSFDKYALPALAPFALYPVAMIALGDLPAAYILRKLLMAAPFALFIGIFNPLLDRDILLQLGPIGIAGGWVSFASIMARFALTVSAALVLVATTGFNAVCMALERLGTPRAFAVQLLFLYRYLFVLIEEAARLSRARSLRSFGGRGTGVRVFVAMIGQLLLRTLDRAQRVHLAMLCRGFDGEVTTVRRMRFGRRDALFLAGWSAAFVLMRLYDLPRLIGAALAGGSP